MPKNLAIDAYPENFTECVRYSSLVRTLVGNQTFILSKLKIAMNDLSEEEQTALDMKFNLSGCWKDNELPKSFSFKNYRRAMRNLVDISKKYFFFTIDYIDYLEDLNNSVLSSELTPTISMTKISDSPFSKRIKNALLLQGIFTIGELSHYTIAEISRFRGLGETSQKEIKRVLKTIYGINLL